VVRTPRRFTGSASGSERRDGNPRADMTRDAEDLVSVHLAFADVRRRVSDGRGPIPAPVSPPDRVLGVDSQAALENEREPYRVFRPEGKARGFSGMVIRIYVLACGLGSSQPIEWMKRRFVPIMADQRDRRRRAAT
jgi:hypothetical protein